MSICKQYQHLLDKLEFLRAIGVVLLVVACSFTTTASAAENVAPLKSVKDIRSVTDYFMKNIEKEQDKLAFLRLVPHSSTTIKERMQEFSQNFSKHMPREKLGKSLGVEFIASEKIGASVVRNYYVHVFSDAIIVWRFLFVGSKDDGWKLLSAEVGSEVALINEVFSIKRAS